jgi:hypothetical protein
MELTKENILSWAKRYDTMAGSVDKEVEERMKKKLAAQRFLSKCDLVEIGLWKSHRPKKRYESNEDAVVRELTKFSFEATTERARIGALCVLSGVSFAVASVILHFAFPERYPILDFHALESLGQSQPNSYTFEFWLDYCDQVKGIAEKLSLPLRTVDKALWQFSKEKGELPASHS